jgi:hypothetical protein
VSINIIIMRIEEIFPTIDLAEAKQTWQKHKNPRAGGMSKKAVRSYRRSNPGSKIQTAVTTKPSKLKKGSKASKRRLSFCRRMRGMKKKRTSAKTARDPNSAINKSLRRWNCESVQDMQELVMIAEQRIQALRENREQGVAEGQDNTLYQVSRAMLDNNPGRSYLRASDDDILRDAGRELSRMGMSDVKVRAIMRDPDFAGELIDTLRGLIEPVRGGQADQQRKIVKKNGEPVGEVGIDRESSPGVGQYYMKHYASGKDYSGYDSMEEALDDLRYIIKQRNYDELRDKKPTQRESLRDDEHHRVRVTLDDGSEKTVRIKTDEGFREQIKRYFAQRGREVVDIDVDWSVRMDEKQDACYHKVRSRYKVWPSAYASGALVQCRKKGADNWGKGSKR